MDSGSIFSQQNQAIETLDQTWSLDQMMCDGRAAVNGRKPGMWNMGGTCEREYEVFQTH